MQIRNVPELLIFVLPFKCKFTFQKKWKGALTLYIPPTCLISALHTSVSVPKQPVQQSGDLKSKLPFFLLFLLYFWDRNSDWSAPTHSIAVTHLGSPAERRRARISKPWNTALSTWQLIAHHPKR